MAKKKKLTKKQKEEMKRKHYQRIRRTRYTTITIVIIAALVIFGLYFFSEDPEDILPELKLLPGFKIDIFADHLSMFNMKFPGPDLGPRMMYVEGDTLFVSVPRSGKVYALRDTDEDGKADEKVVFMKGLDKPHGIAGYGDWIYIAEEDEVIRVKWDVSSMIAFPDSKEVIISDLPHDGGHWTRSIVIHNNQLYVSIGSSCNNCVEDDVRRASVIQCELDQDICDPFAIGIRNAVGLEWYRDILFATENGRDWLGDDFPPDEINKLEKGRHYGWPYCHARNEPDPSLGSKEKCKDMALPALDIQAHSEPLGLAFYHGSKFPAEYHGNLFVAYHGSWNRKNPTGYKIVRVFSEESSDDVNLLGTEDFITGWLTKSGDVLGRPVDIVNWIDGSFLITDDKAGVIYRVWYEG